MFRPLPKVESMPNASDKRVVAELLGLAAALLAIARGVVSVRSAWFVVGSIVLASGLLGDLLWYLPWIAVGRWRRVAVALGLLAGAAYACYVLWPRASFVFLFPDAWMPGTDVMHFSVMHRGEETLFKVGFKIDYQEQERAISVPGQIVTAAEIAAGHREIEFSEIGPKNHGQIEPAAFWWSAPVRGNAAHFNVLITQRSGNALQRIAVSRIGTAWVYAIRVDDADNGRILLACRDHAAPIEYGLEDAKPCVVELQGRE